MPVRDENKEMIEQHLLKYLHTEEIAAHELCKLGDMIE